ncbi:MAG: glycerophosphodiester phosphodiesterase family protein [Bacteroidales bacterium]
MRNLSLLFFMLVLTIPTYAWKPIFVGHRGSYRGVANTAEAFRNGVDVYGYDGLECDIRVTSDGEYVIMHDETTTSLGGSLTVTEATLAELKAETLTQTRSGNTYTGTICTAAEYLDICNEKGAFPVIELKWTDGINSNDMSNFPGLMELVVEKGLLDKAIFLTSMQASIEYIRTNYPTATCQFLTGEYWANHVDWCIEWNVAPSIQSGYFDASTVKQFHELGFDVAMWTVNTEANYKLYGNMGVAMMTCDYLYATEMDELDDIDWDASDDQDAAIELETSVLWSHTYVDNTLPTDFPVGSGTYSSAQQATVIDGIFYANNYTTSELVALDQNGFIETEYTGTNTHGITSDDAGNLIQRNDGLTATPNSMLITKYGETSAKEISFELINQGQTNFISASGDIFSEEGGYIYFFPNGHNYVNFVKIANGELVEVTASEELSTTGSTAGMVYPMGNNTDNFIYQVRNVGYYLYQDGEDMGDYLTGSSSTTAPGRNSSIGGAYLNVGGHDIFIHTSGTNYNGGLTVRDMTADGEVLATFPELGSLGYSGNPSVGTFITPIEISENYYIAYAYTMGGGIAAYEIALEGSSVEDNTIIQDKTAELSIYPNPAINNVTIKSSDAINSIAVYSINGVKVIDIAGNGANAETIEVSSLPQGLYIVKVNNSAVTRLIKR